MSTAMLRAARWLALGIVAFVVAVGLPAVSLLIVSIPDDQQRLGYAINAILVIPYALIGPVLVYRVPSNAVGWILSVSSVWIVYSQVTRVLGVDRVAGGQVELLLAAALLLFPSGRPPSRLWGFVWTLWLAAAALTVVTPIPRQLVLALLGLAAASLVLRLIRAAGIERQQLKWLAYAAVVAIGLMSINTAIGCNGTIRIGGRCAFPIVADTMWGLTFLALPVAMAIAILRYRLYDIDVVIRRTLVYGIVSAILGGTFLVAQLTLQTALRPLTAGNDLAVAASTLLIAALFVPLRRWIRRFVDQRFYRRTYDAQRAVDAFSAHLRDAIDLEPISQELSGVITTSLQPRASSLWLRERKS